MESEGTYLSNRRLQRPLFGVVMLLRMLYESASAGLVKYEKPRVRLHVDLLHFEPRSFDEPCGTAWTLASMSCLLQVRDSGSS